MKSSNKKVSGSSKALRKTLKRLMWIVVVGVILAAVGLAAMPKPVSVEPGEISQGLFVVTINEDGRTRVKDRHVISAPLAGSLARIELHPGDSVKQGDVLARLVPLQAPLLDARTRAQAESRVAASRAGTNQAKAQIERALAAYEFAEDELERVTQLHKSQVVSQQELDRVQLELRARHAELASAEFGSKVARHELRMALAAFGFQENHNEGQTLTVTSPITGRVLKVLQQSEGVVQAGAPLIEVGNPKALEIVVDVLTRDAVNIRPGSPVSVEEWGGDKLAAAVRLIEPSAFSRLSALGVEEQRVNAVIDLHEDYELWSKLGDGYRVETRIEIYRADNALLAPQSSLFRRDGKWATFIVEGELARLRTLTIGRRNDQYIQILEGLEPGDQVVLHPSDKVTDGVEVQLLNQ